MQARARNDAELTFATPPQEPPRELKRSLKTRHLNMIATYATLPLFLAIWWGYRWKTGCRFVRYEDMNVGELH